MFAEKRPARTSGRQCVLVGGVMAFAEKRPARFSGRQGALVADVIKRVRSMPE